MIEIVNGFIIFWRRQMKLYADCIRFPVAEKVMQMCDNFTNSVAAAKCSGKSDAET